MLRLLAAVAVGSLVLSGVSSAQTGGGKARPGQKQKGAKGQPKAPAKAAPEEPEPVRLRADVQEMVGEGHYRARGFVDLHAGAVRLQADELDLYQTKRPDGGETRRIVAQGNVVFLQGEERISGERLEMDLDTGKGTFEEAVGYVQPGVFVEARTIERVDTDTYRVQGARFTSCSQPNPRWSFRASSARIEVDDKILAKNVLFKVKSVPAFYTPFFMYPIREDLRSTGFLFPHFEQSNLRGFKIGSGFFWAMGRSTDQTFYFDRYSKFGYGFGHEFRYVRDQPSRGTFRTYGFRPKDGGTWDYDLNWNAVQALPGRFRASVRVNRTSNQDFQQSIEDDLNRASRRTRRSSASLARSFGATSFSIDADSTETFYDEIYLVNRRLPTVRLAQSPRKIGKSPLVLQYELRGESLELGDQDSVDRYARYDAVPQLSANLSVPFLQVTPRAKFRYTRYGKSLEEAGDRDSDLVDEPVTRRYFEGSVEMTGPTFQRIFNTGWRYSDKIKHVIGPEFVYTYRTRVDDFDRIPRFDDFDLQPGTNQLQYGLVQRLFSRRVREGGKPVPYELLNWRVFQTYYFDIGSGQNDFDPNYSSAAFAPGGEPAHKSPISSRLRFRPTPAYSADFGLEYDVNFKEIRRLSVSSSLNTSPLDLNVGWVRRNRIRIVQGTAEISDDTIRSSGRLGLLGNRVTLRGSADYDILRKTVLHSSASLRYDVQCCGFTAEMIQFKYNTRDERKYRFSIELANIGSIGNFLGEDLGRIGGGSY